MAFEETPPDLGMEFRRRARIGAGDFQSLALVRPLHGSSTRLDGVHFRLSQAPAMALSVFSDRDRR